MTLGHEHGEASQARAWRGAAILELIRPIGDSALLEGHGRPVAFRAASIARLSSAPEALKVSMSVVGTSIRYFRALRRPR